ncbi:MAG: O-succinylbenzoate synthase [Acidimicrobiales bacterium]|jgi:O-succinylbenzoate synthase
MSGSDLRYPLDDYLNSTLGLTRSDPVRAVISTSETSRDLLASYLVSSPTHLTLRLLKLPTRSSLAAAHGVPTESFRMLTLVGLHVDNDLSQVVGWGECSALNEPGYTTEWAEGAFDLIRGGGPLDPATAPMASAAIEMAMLDAELKQAGQSLSDRLGTTGLSSTAGAVVGLAPLPTMLDEIEVLAAQGYGRIKIKIAPGKIVVPIQAIRASFPELELHVDANGSLQDRDMASLVRLRDLGVRVVEQPFAADNLQAAARLVADTDLAVAADEAVQSPLDIDTLATHRAATAVVLKPSKLGGIRVALDVLDRIQVAGMHAIIGGMLESGLGRHVLAALAPLPAFTLTGDLSPASRWLEDDPFQDISMRNGMIPAPTQPGIAGEPVANLLDRYTVRDTTIAASQMERLV